MMLDQYKFIFDKEEICCQAFKIVPKSGKHYLIGYWGPIIFAWYHVYYGSVPEKVRLTPYGNLPDQVVSLGTT